MFFLGIGIDTMIQGDWREKDSECAKTKLCGCPVGAECKKLTWKTPTRGL